MVTVKIRRRVEKRLRKSASKQDIIHIAVCLGIKMKKPLGPSPLNKSHQLDSVALGFGK